MAHVATLIPRHQRELNAIRAQLMEIVRERSFKEGEFTLSSGKKSNLYFNMKPTMMNARGAELSARCFMDMLSNHNVSYISGLEMGAVPVIGSIAALSSAEGVEINTTFVRKQAKSHGTMDLVEGLGPNDSIRDKYVVVIDDVATTGKSIFQAIEAVRNAGGIVEHAMCIVDREEGAEEFLTKKGISLTSIFKGKEFLSSK